MTWHGDLRLMLTGLYPSKDPATCFTEYRRYSRVLAHTALVAFQGMGAHICAYDQAGMRQDSLEFQRLYIAEWGTDAPPKAFVYESVGRPKNVK
jgi:hypothetical protein